MKTPLHLLFCFAPALALPQALVDAGSAELKLSANTPTVNIGPRNAGRAPLNLPELEYQFRIEASCNDDLAPASLLLAVADTRRGFDPGQIGSGELEAVRLRIPAKQIAPIIIEDFCTTATDASNAQVSSIVQMPVTIHAALSAQASLLCLGDGRQAMKYASAVLDVILLCVESNIAAGLPAD